MRQLDEVINRYLRESKKLIQYLKWCAGKLLEIPKGESEGGKRTDTWGIDY